MEETTDVAFDDLRVRVDPPNRLQGQLVIKVLVNGKIVTEDDYCLDVDRFFSDVNASRGRINFVGGCGHGRCCGTGYLTRCSPECWIWGWPARPEEPPGMIEESTEEQGVDEVIPGEFDSAHYVTDIEFIVSPGPTFSPPQPIESLYDLPFEVQHRFAWSDVHAAARQVLHALESLATDHYLADRIPFYREQLEELERKTCA